MTTTDSALDFIRSEAYEHGSAGLTLAATLACIAEESGVVMTEVDFAEAIAGHTEGRRANIRGRKSRTSR